MTKIKIATKNQNRTFSAITDLTKPIIELVGPRGGDAVLVENDGGLGWFIIQNNRTESCTWERA